MRMKFFEKTYLLMLSLFLLFLNGSIFSLALYTHHNTLQAEEQVCISEEFAVKEAFERDHKDGIFSSDKLLQMTYCAFYKEKGITLSFAGADGNSYSNLPAGLSIPNAGKLTNETFNGKRYILITQAVCDGKFIMTYAKDVSHLDADYQKMAIYFVVASLVASTLLAILLYLTLRKLYSPLDKLRKVTQKISSGDLSARADSPGDDELSALAKDFNRMADRVTEQMNQLKTTAEQKQRMLDDLAHEMRTPLTSIHGYAEYICAANISPEEQIEASQYIIHESMRLKNISQILLDSAFIREKKVEKTHLCAAALLEDTRKRHTLCAVERGVEIVCLPGDADVEGDRILLELLLSNLTENAVKACSEGGRVELSVYHEGGRPVLCVTDNGVGMTAEALTHITEPFYRIDKSRSRQEGGTGLGLALCVTIAQAHGIRLVFESEPGNGTKVYVKF